MDAKYYHFTVHGATGPGVLTLCVVDSVHIGWALCSPLDRFNRKKGRLIATGRAACPRSRLTVLWMSGMPSQEDMAAIVVNTLSDLGRRPKWLPQYPHISLRRSRKRAKASL